MSTTKDAFVLNKYFYVRDKGVQFIKIVYTKTTMIYENTTAWRYVCDKDIPASPIFKYQIEV